VSLIAMEAQYRYPKTLTAIFY